MTKNLTAKTTLPILALGLALSACSGSFSIGGDDTIEGKKIGELAEDALQSQNAQLAEGSFDCPDIKKEEGEEITCTRSTEVHHYYVEIDGTVKLSEVDGDDIRVQVQMENQAKAMGTRGEVIADYITSTASQQLGGAATDVTCPDLPGEDGAKVTCEATVNGEQKKIEATAKDVDLQKVAMGYSLAEA